MVRHLLEDHPAARPPRTPGDGHPDLRGDVEQLPRLDHLHAVAEHAEHPARTRDLPRRVSKPVEPHHGRLRARDPADPHRLYRRAALLRPRHRDHRHEIDTGEPRRATFDEAAELYDRARPGYPPELFDDLTAIAGLRPGARLLEIGCGTGQATQPLAERKFQITAIELGPNLAAVARRKLARFCNVAVEVAAFEEWPLPAEPFDAVVSATAFHWLDSSARGRR